MMPPPFVLPTMPRYVPVGRVLVGKIVERKNGVVSPTRQKVTESETQNKNPKKKLESGFGFP